MTYMACQTQNLLLYMACQNMVDNQAVSTANISCCKCSMMLCMHIKEEVREDGYMQTGLQVPYCCRHQQPATL